MRRRLIQASLVVLLTCVVGGHWAILQGVAWASMLARFSQTMPLAQAVEYTFDGQHPCSLCHAVKEGKEAERKESKLKPPERLLLGLMVPPPTLPPPPAAVHRSAPDRPLASFRDAPPRPPPRAA